MSLKHFGIIFSLIVALVLFPLNGLSITTSSPVNTITDHHFPVITLFNGNGAYHVEVEGFKQKTSEWGYVLNIIEHFTNEYLEFTDILILNAPDFLTPLDRQLISDWWATGNRTIWFAGDSDYGGSYNVSDLNYLVVELGLNVTLQDDGVEDAASNDGTPYRVLANTTNSLWVNDSITTGVYNVSFHAPTCVVPYSGNQSGINLGPKWDDLPFTDWIINTSNAGMVYGEEIDNDTIWKGYPLNVPGSYTLAAVQWQIGPKGSSKAVWMGESIFVDYQGTFTNTTLWGGFGQQNLPLTYNLLRWANDPDVSILNKVPRVFVFNGHNAFDDSVEGFKSNASAWGFEVVVMDLLDPYLLAESDILILNGNGWGNRVSFTPVELDVILRWWAYGNRTIWFAGDSDYGGYWNPSMFNNLSLALGGQMIIQDDSIHDGIPIDGLHGYAIANVTNSLGPIANLTSGVNDLFYRRSTVIAPYSGGLDGINTMPKWTDLPYTDWIVNSSQSGEIVDQDFDADNVWEGYPTFTLGSWTLTAVQWHLGPWNNSRLIMSGESIFADYKNMFAYTTPYLPYPIDNIPFVHNLLNWALPTDYFKYTQVREEPSTIYITDLQHTLHSDPISSHYLLDNEGLNVSFLVQNYPNAFLGVESVYVNFSSLGFEEMFLPKEVFFGTYSLSIPGISWPAGETVEMYVYVKDNLGYETYSYMLSFDIRSSDSIPPVVEILSPQHGSSYDFRGGQVFLVYTIFDDQNFTVEVFLNNISIGFKSNGSILTEISSSGDYTLRIEATDEANNIGVAEVVFTVFASGTTAVPTTPTSSTTLTTTTPYPISTQTSQSIGFPLLFLLVLVIPFYRRRISKSR